MNKLTEAEKMQVDSIVGGLKPALSSPQLDKRLISIALIQLAKELCPSSDQIIGVTCASSDNK